MEQKSLGRESMERKPANQKPMEQKFTEQESCCCGDGEGLAEKPLSLYGEQGSDYCKDSKAGASRNPVFVGTVLLFAGTAVAMIQYKVPSIMMKLMDLFSLDAAAVSWLMSIFTLTGIFAAFPAGMLAQRFGAKRMVIASCAIAVAGSFLGAFAESGLVLVASRAVEGVALAFLTTCAPIVVRQCVSSDRLSTAMGIWGIWGCVGSTLAAVATPALFEGLGFIGLWLTFAAIPTMAAVLVGVTIRTSSAFSLSDDTSGQVDSRGVASCCRLLLGKDVLFFFAGFALFNICLLGVLSFVPTILQMQGFDSTLSGFVSTAPMLLSIVSSPLFGVLSDKVGRCKPLLLAAMLTMGPCTFALFTQTGTLLWVAVAVMGLVSMGGVGLFLAVLARLLPASVFSSVGMGAMITVQGIGQFLGTFFVQLLLGSDFSNWAFAGAVLMVLGLLGACAIARCSAK